MNGCFPILFHAESDPMTRWIVCWQRNVHGASGTAHVVGTSADKVVGNGSKMSDKDSDENRGLADDRGELR